MTEYLNTIIYQIVCKDVNIIDCYVGHTTNFINRYNNHLNRCNNLNDVKSNYKVYQFIRENGGWENWEMLEIEKYPCNDEFEAKKQERYYIETLGATLNSSIPTRTYKEWCEENKEQLIENKKNYYQENKNEIKEQKEIYYRENKEKILKYQDEYRKNHKEQIVEKRKQNYQENKNEIKEQRKINYEKNKTQILFKMKQKTTCICGSVCNKSDIRKHEKTNKHIEYIKQNIKS